MDNATQRLIDDLNEVSYEISRVNRAAGETIFNPAATSALRYLIERIENGEISISELTPA